VEEFRDVQEPVPIPLHLTAGRVVSSKTWDRLRKSRNAIHKIVVSDIVSLRKLRDYGNSFVLMANLNRT